jgi:hypothetical protein
MGVENKKDDDNNEELKRIPYIDILGGKIIGSGSVPVSGTPEDVQEIKESVDNLKRRADEIRREERARKSFFSFSNVSREKWARIFGKKDDPERN